MKTGFNEHMLVGVALFAIILIFVNDPAEIPLAGIFAMMGAVLPDMDSPSSKPRRAMRWVFLACGFLLVLLFYPQISGLCNDFASKSSCEYLPFLSVGVLFAAIFVLDSVIPRHRGFLHSLSAALLYGFAACLVMLYLGIGGITSLRIGGWAFAGYISHLLVDIVGDAIPFK